MKYLEIMATIIIAIFASLGLSQAGETSLLSFLFIIYGAIRLGIFLIHKSQETSPYHLEQVASTHKWKYIQGDTGKLTGIHKGYKFELTCKDNKFYTFLQCPAPLSSTFVLHPISLQNKLTEGDGMQKTGDVTFDKYFTCECKDQTLKYALLSPEIRKIISNMFSALSNISITPRGPDDCEIVFELKSGAHKDENRAKGIYFLMLDFLKHTYMVISKGLCFEKLVENMIADDFSKTKKNTLIHLIAGFYNHQHYEYNTRVFQKLDPCDIKTLINLFLEDSKHDPLLMTELTEPGIFDYLAILREINKPFCIDAVCVLYRAVGLEKIRLKVLDSLEFFKNPVCQTFIMEQIRKLTGQTTPLYWRCIEIMGICGDPEGLADLTAYLAETEGLSTNAIYDCEQAIAAIRIRFKDKKFDGRLSVSGIEKKRGTLSVSQEV